MIYDVDLTLGLPVGLTVVSALNAIAHAMEALYAPDRNPVTELMARDALGVFRDALPRIVAAPQDGTRARTRSTQPGAARPRSARPRWRCTTSSRMCLAASSARRTPRPMRSCCRTPPPTTRRLSPDLLAPVAEAFGGRGAGAGLWDFAAELGAPLRLSELGLSEADLDRAADAAVRSAYANPRPLERGAIRDLLQAAWEGRRPDERDDGKGRTR